MDLSFLSHPMSEEMVRLLVLVYLMIDQNLALELKVETLKLKVNYVRLY